MSDNGLPKIAKEWKAIPTVPEDLSGDELAPIVALPKVLPHAVAAYALRDMYQFCTTDTCKTNDWDIEWGSTDSYSMAKLTIKKYESFSCYSPSTDTPEGSEPIEPSPADICDDDSNSTGGGSVDVNKPTVPSPYYYWLTAALNAQGENRLGVWIRDTALLKSGHVGAGTLLQGLPVHAPATPVRPPQPPMPTPSFAPASRGGGGKVKLGDSVKPVLRVDEKTGKLEAEPPEISCIDGSNCVLVYDEATRTMSWECPESTCCIVKLEEVPPTGFGNGTARPVTGFEPDGSCIYGDELIPVKIPRL